MNLEEPPGPPKLGYCTLCLDMLWNDLSAYGRRVTRVDGDPAAMDSDRAGTYLVSRVAAALDAFERGARVSIGGEQLRLRADVLSPDEPRCAEHYRIVLTARGPVLGRRFM